MVRGGRLARAKPDDFLDCAARAVFADVHNGQGHLAFAGVVPGLGRQYLDCVPARAADLMK